MQILKSKYMRSQYNLTRMILLVTLCLTFGTFSLKAQQERAATVSIKFDNPDYDAVSQLYTVDIMLKASNRQVLYGINLRFFYDATLMKFHSVDHFAPGYDFIGKGANPVIGTPRSGVELFDLDGAVGYINGGIQMLEKDHPLILDPSRWNKLARATFTLSELVQEGATFCPAIIWDQKTAGYEGGILQGNDGVVVTVEEHDRSTRVESSPTYTVAEPFNYTFYRMDQRPYGSASGDNCITIGQSVSTSNPTDGEQYVLFQNNPNPFEDYTIVEFELPRGQKANINIIGLDGKLMEQIKGDYPAGKSQVTISRKPWMNSARSLYYQLEVEDGTKLVKKMSLVTH